MWWEWNAGSNGTVADRPPVIWLNWDNCCEQLALWSWICIYINHHNCIEACHFRTSKSVDCLCFLFFAILDVTRTISSCSCVLAATFQTMKDSHRTDLHECNHRLLVSSSLDPLLDSWRKRLCSLSTSCLTLAPYHRYITTEYWVCFCISRVVHHFGFQVKQGCMHCEVSSL